MAKRNLCLNLDAYLDPRHPNPFVCEEDLASLDELLHVSSSRVAERPTTSSTSLMGRRDLSGEAHINELHSAPIACNSSSTLCKLSLPTPSQPAGTEFLSTIADPDEWTPSPPCLSPNPILDDLDAPPAPAQLVVNFNLLFGTGRPDRCQVVLTKDTTTSQLFQYLALQASDLLHGLPCKGYTPTAASICVLFIEVTGQRKEGVHLKPFVKASAKRRYPHEFNDNWRILASDGLVLQQPFATNPDLTKDAFNVITGFVYPVMTESKRGGRRTEAIPTLKSLQELTGVVTANKRRVQQEKQQFKRKKLAQYEDDSEEDSEEDD